MKHGLVGFAFDRSIEPLDAAHVVEGEYETGAQEHVYLETNGMEAWLDGDVTDDAGVIDLPLRVDVDDRPRQIHDPVAGKAARSVFRPCAPRIAPARASDIHNADGHAR